jgi:hypothetical protein
VKIHLLDPDRSNGIRCNNPGAGQAVTADPEQVTCICCRPGLLRPRHVDYDPGTRVPPGPSLGD